MRGDGFKSLIDGDMRIALGDRNATVSGKRLTLSQSGTPATLAVAAETVSESRTMTLRDYKQAMVMRDDRVSIESNAVVETDAFGATSTYQLSTPKSVVWSADIFRSGQFKVVGAGDTILYITANGDGTFKLERDDGGDGSIDDSVTPVDAEDLNLQAPFSIIL